MGCEIYAKLRVDVLKKAKFPLATVGGTPPLRSTSPPDFLKTGRARGQNFIAFLDSLGLYDHFEPNIVKYVRAVFE